MSTENRPENRPEGHHESCTGAHETIAGEIYCAPVTESLPVDHAELAALAERFLHGVVSAAELSTLVEAVPALLDKVEELTAERDEWKRRRDNAVETCRFRHQDGLTAEEWHARFCGAMQGVQRERARAVAAERRVADLEAGIAALMCNPDGERQWHNQGRSGWHKVVDVHRLLSLFSQSGKGQTEGCGSDWCPDSRCIDGQTEGQEGKA